MCQKEVISENSVTQLGFSKRGWTQPSALVLKGHLHTHFRNHCAQFRVLPVSIPGWDSGPPIPAVKQQIGNKQKCGDYKDEKAELESLQFGHSA